MLVRFLFNYPLQLPLLHLAWIKVQTQKLAFFSSLTVIYAAFVLLNNRCSSEWSRESRELKRISKLSNSAVFLVVQQIVRFPRASCFMIVNSNSLTYSCN